MKEKKVLIACNADPSSNPRTYRAIELCCSLGMEVSFLGLPCQERMPFPVADYFELSSRKLTNLTKLFYKFCLVGSAWCPLESARIFFEKTLYGLGGLQQKIAGKKFDLIIVANIEMLPAIFEIQGSAKVIFDAREFYPRELDGDLVFELFRRPRRIQLCKRYLVHCDAVLTVSEGLQQAFATSFGIDAALYRSTPFYADLSPQPTDKNCIRMIYHGAANRDRQIEKLIEITRQLDSRFRLTLMLVGNKSYQSELQRIASDMENVRFRSPVLFEEIIPTVSQYDIGFFYSEPKTFNLLHCLPNKFFEYIQARLMIAIGPSPDMAALVKEYGCGVVAEEFTVSSMVAALNALTVEDIDQGKRNADRAAKEFCLEKEKERKIRVMAETLGFEKEESL